MKCNLICNVGGGMVIGAALVLVIQLIHTDDISYLQEQQSLIAEYYAEEVATLVSPHSIRLRMDTGDDSFILVDTRSREDYEREHIIGAINIDSAESFSDVLEAYQALDQTKEIIIYCYSASCMNGRKVGNFLAENGVFVKEMTVGWNEWRYEWRGWNYDSEWDSTDVMDYVTSGTEPGTPLIREDHEGGCGIEGGFSC